MVWSWGRLTEERREDWNGVTPHSAHSDGYLLILVLHECLLFDQCYLQPKPNIQCVVDALRPVTMALLLLYKHTNVVYNTQCTM